MNPTKKVERLPRSVLLTCTLACAAAAGLGQTSAIPQEIRPVGTETVAPRWPERIKLSGLPPVPRRPGPVSTLDPETYRKLKEAAAVDPHAEIPNAIVPLLPEPTSAAVNSQTGAKEASGLSLTTANATQLASFAGLDHTASLGSDGLFRPPDTTLGKNGTRVLEGTNSALRLFSTAGAILDTKSLNTFFGVDPGVDGIVFDPRVVFDRLGPNQRWFVVALSRNDATKRSRIYVAVSRTANPNLLSTSLATGQWCTYMINAARDLVSGSPTTWADYPMVGVGADAFLISNDQFTFPNPNDYDYKYGILRVIRKDLITNNAASCPALSTTVFAPLNGTTGTKDDMGHVQPAIHYTAPSSFPGVTNPAYMMSTVVPSSNVYRVWRVANVASGSPTVSVINHSVGPNYLFPLSAFQPPGGASTLDTKDARVMQVAALGDTLFATHATSCVNPGGTFNKPCIRTLRFFVSDSGGSLSALLQEQLTLASPDTSINLAYFMPGIAVNNSSQTAVVFLASSPTQYLSAAYTTKSSIEPFYGAGTTFLSGTCARTSSRVGDYVGAQTNPDDLVSFWLAGENAAPFGAQCRWKTQVVQVTP